MVDEAGMGVEDGIVSLDQNVNDLAMGVPPGVPGAIDDTPGTRTRNVGTTLNVPTDRRGGTGRYAYGGKTEGLTILASLPANAHGQIPIATPNGTDQSGGDRCGHGSVFQTRSSTAMCLCRCRLQKHSGRRLRGLVSETHPASDITIAIDITIS